MAIFNSHVKLPEGTQPCPSPLLYCKSNKHSQTSMFTMFYRFDPQGSTSPWLNKFPSFLPSCNSATADGANMCQPTVRILPKTPGPQDGTRIGPKDLRNSGGRLAVFAHGLSGRIIQPWFLPMGIQLIQPLPDGIITRPGKHTKNWWENPAFLMGHYFDWAIFSSKLQTFTRGYELILMEHITNADFVCW